jgi:hypothetical protein
VGLTIDITLLLFSSSMCASWHGSSLILCAACSASGERSKREHSKAPASLIDNGSAFGPRKASKVEKPSSRGVSSLHRWSLMLLPVLWLMPLCALCTHVCVSTTLCLLSFASLPHCCSFPELGPMTQIDLSALLLLHLDNMTERTNRIGDLTWQRVS